jgi:hypothetical protein
MIRKFGNDVQVWRRIHHPRPRDRTKEGVIEVLRQSTDPKAKGAPPESFIDDGLVRELAQRGMYR